MKSSIKQYQISIFFVINLFVGWLSWYTGRGSIIIAAPSIAALIVALGAAVLLVSTKGQLGFQIELENLHCFNDLRSIKQVE